MATRLTLELSVTPESIALHQRAGQVLTNWSQASAGWLKSRRRRTEGRRNEVRVHDPGQLQSNAETDVVKVDGLTVTFLRSGVVRDVFV